APAPHLLESRCPGTTTHAVQPGGAGHPGPGTHRRTRTTRWPAGAGARDPKKSLTDAGWSVAEKREVVMNLGKTYPIRLVCRLLGVPRSSVYYACHPYPDGDAMIKSALLDVAAEYPTYGYRRLSWMLRRLDWPVNFKRVRRWMAELGINGTPPARKHRTTNSQ